MKQILIQLDDATAIELERVAPGSGRKRSEFLRGVIARALHETLERGTRVAYEKWPDEAPSVRSEDWADGAEAVHPAPRRAPTKKPRNVATQKPRGKARR